MRIAALVLLALSLMRCNASPSQRDADPDGGPTVCPPQLHGPACGADLLLGRAELPAVPSERSEGTYLGVEGSVVRLDVDGATVEIPTPRADALAAWLPEGEPVVLRTQTGAHAAPGSYQSELRLERASDGALLLALVRSEAFAPTPAVLELVEGLGVIGTERRAACSYLHELGFGCAPLPMVGHDLVLQVADAADVVAALGEPVVVQTSAGRFEIENRGSGAMDTGSYPGCTFCGPYIATTTHVDIARVE